LLRTAFHQDASFFALRGEQVAVCWVLCDEVTEASGAIGYVRGSHRWPDRDGKPGVVLQGKSFVTNLPKRKENPGERSQPAYHVPDIEDHEEDYDIVYFEAQPGDVVIHHCNTLHGSRGNTSSVRHRRAASVRYIGDDVVAVVRRDVVPAPPSEGTLAEENLEYGLRPGGPIEGPLWWQCWPREPMEGESSTVAKL